MTEKERAEWQRRCMRFQETLEGNPPPSLEARLDWLEADASAQRSAILTLERRIEVLAGAIVLALIIAQALLIAMEMLT